jgi:serine phosphatase RsbU (regulator of sigma subunit)
MPKHSKSENKSPDIAKKGMDEFELARLTLKCLPYGLLRIDGEDTISYANLYMELLLGVPGEQIIGRPVRLLAFIGEELGTLIGSLKTEDSAQKTIIVKKGAAARDLHLLVRGMVLNGQRQVLFENITEQVLLQEKLGKYRKELEDTVLLRTRELLKQNRELLNTQHSLEAASKEIESELEMAKQIQESILPESLPQIPGYGFAVRYTPTGKIGGDFYNIVRLDDEYLLMLEADVSGHGVPAAFITAIAKSCFDRNIRPQQSLEVSMRQINKELCESIKTEHYLTAFIALLHVPTGNLRYCRIGHPYPIIVRHGTGAIEYLTARGGFFLGMLEDENDFNEERTQLDPGDKLLIYTDGLYECFNNQNLQYGRRKLGASALKHRALHVDDFLKNIMSDKEAFSDHRPDNDDITVLAIERTK